jgi:hypothetical protein
MWLNPVAWIVVPIYVGIWILLVGGFWLGHALSCLRAPWRGGFVACWRDRPEPNTPRGVARVTAGALILLLVANS